MTDIKNQSNLESEDTQIAKFRFWISDKFGLIRQNKGTGGGGFPEIWGATGWQEGSPYVMDAITGLGEDLWSCGESADECDSNFAKRYAEENGIKLCAPRGST
jgi:hypothetical protein